MRHEEKVNKILGITNENEIIMLNEFFEYDGSLKGATGSSFYAFDQKYCDERNDPENAADDYKEIWQEAVRYDQTEKGLVSFVRDLIANDDDEFFIGRDSSHTYAIEDLEEFLSTHMPGMIGLACTGGGRMFDQGFFDRVEWKVLFEPELLLRIKKIEGVN